MSADAFTLLPDIKNQPGRLFISSNTCSITRDESGDDGRPMLHVMQTLGFSQSDGSLRSRTYTVFLPKDGTPSTRKWYAEILAEDAPHGAEDLGWARHLLSLPMPTHSCRKLAEDGLMAYYLSTAYPVDMVVLPDGVAVKGERTAYLGDGGVRTKNVEFRPCLTLDETGGSSLSYLAKGAESDPYVESALAAVDEWLEVRRAEISAKGSSVPGPMEGDLFRVQLVKRLKEEDEHLRSWFEQRADQL